MSTRTAISHGDSSAILTGTCAHPAGYAEVGGDCDATEFAVNPDQIELCNGHDDDCDELVDTEDDSLVGGDVWYEDADFDGFGDVTTGTFLCDRPDGWVDNGEDCDDANVHVHPGNPETCDDVDNDCDELTDDDDPDVQGEVEIYADTDGELFGDASASRSACTVLPGYVRTRTTATTRRPTSEKALRWPTATTTATATAGRGVRRVQPGPSDALVDGDCDITDASIHPGAPGSAQPRQRLQRSPGRGRPRTRVHGLVRRQRSRRVRDVERHSRKL
jgi:hypothetical protein